VIGSDRRSEVKTGIGENYYRQEVLLFLGQHPRARFSLRTIVHALNSNQWCIEQTLESLTAEGAVRTGSENGLTLYSLGTRR